MSLVLLPIDEVVTFDALTHDPDTGSIRDADSAPTYSVFDGATDVPILSAQTMTKRTSLTGDYRGTFTASAANNFVAGHSYNVIVSATVTGTVSLTAISSKWRALVFRCAPAENSAGIPRVDVDRILGTASAGTAGTVRADSVTDISTAANTEVTAVPASTASLRDMLKWIYLLSRNKLTQTSSTTIVKAADGSTTVSSSTVSDDGTTATRGTFS